MFLNSFYHYCWCIIFAHLNEKMMTKKYFWKNIFENFCLACNKLENICERGACVCVFLVRVATVTTTVNY